MIASILPAILPTVGKLVDLGFGSEMKSETFYHQKKVAIAKNPLWFAEDAPFTSLRAGTGYLNLISQPKDKKWTWWGRVIFYVNDVDVIFEKVIAQGIKTDTTPRDAEWGERYFHVTDPDGHEISFAKPLM